MILSEMGLCYLCGKEVDIPHRCPFCNLTFCDEHRIPEQHNCMKAPNRTWNNYKKIQKARFDQNTYRKSSIFKSIKQRFREKRLRKKK